MDGTLDLSIAALAYADGGMTNSPVQRFFDWSRRELRSVGNPKGLPYTVPSGAIQVIFDGTRSTSVGSATEFALSVSSIPGSVGRYRLAWTSVGQNPAFRTDRGLALSGVPLTWTANGNLTETLAASAGTFAGVVVGDVLLVPDITTGDAAYPGNPLNAGRWTVIAKAGDSSSVQLARPTGTPFSGAAESFTPTTNAQVLAFSAAGVQVGDGMNVSAGFVVPVVGTYTVLAVAPAYVEFQTSKALPVAATAVPGTAGIAFFSSYKTFVLVLADQDCHLLVNGSTDSTESLSPANPGDLGAAAPYLKDGPTWALSVANDSLADLNVLALVAE